MVGGGVLLVCGYSLGFGFVLVDNCIEMSIDIGYGFVLGNLFLFVWFVLFNVF